MQRVGRPRELLLSNFVRKTKLKYDDIHVLILTKEVHRKDFGEILGFNFAFNIDS